MEQLITLLTGPGGLLVALLVIIFTGMKRYWVFGWYAREIKQDRDEWKDAAIKGTYVAERVTRATEERKHVQA